MRSWSVEEKARSLAKTGIRASFSCGPTPRCCIGCVFVYVYTCVCVCVCV
jgi:hypothetical protein